eukprot:CAMPEP_0114149470 /NCGR_PEP_ID=MMETSP0043_2-20121206/22175_1 /TAXON_ID=464988 /ORGANISM="Hemiselmis andersenii, Strain CCMP644" /LENGTH=371 /DNA_ID=CAMNT_0001244113 /DNA_START=122 /DNA_END=1234 /DNA_ORIENTATION=-
MGQPPRPDNEFLVAFEKNSKKAVDSWVQTGKLPSDAKAIAAFLRQPELDLAGVGNYIGEGDDLCIAVLSEFVRFFDFFELGFDDAMRKFLAGFRLPGEAQKIDRIMHAFASQFHTYNPDMFRDPETAYPLAYSVIMLNTDAHNPAIKPHKKMTKEQFIKNNRGLDNGHDLDREFLERIYDRIVANEIVVQTTSKDDGSSDKSILTYSNPEKAGWLKKQSSRMRSWNDRWFVLKDGCIYYFRKPPVWGQSVQLCGYIPLHPQLLVQEGEPGVSSDTTITMEMADGTPAKCGKIDKRIGSMKTIAVQQLRLLSPSRSDRGEWVSCIRTAISDLSNNSNRRFPSSSSRSFPSHRPDPSTTPSGGAPAPQPSAKP